MNKRTKKLLGLMDAANKAATKNKNEQVSINKPTKSVVEPPPQPKQIQTIGSPCMKCGEPCHYDFNKMVQVNNRNNKKHWCPYGDLPVNTKCKHCNTDLVFNRLHYDDIRGTFIPLEKGTLNLHRCLTAAKKKHMLL